MEIRVTRFSRKPIPNTGPAWMRRYCTPRRRMLRSSSLISSEDSVNAVSTGIGVSVKKLRV